MRLIALTLAVQTVTEYKANIVRTALLGWPVAIPTVYRRADGRAKTRDAENYARDAVKRGIYRLW